MADSKTSVRFQVTKAEEDSIAGKETEYGAVSSDRVHIEVPERQGDDVKSTEMDSLTGELRQRNSSLATVDKHMALYEEEFEKRPKVAYILSKLANYKAGMAPSEHEMETAQYKPKEAKLGTLLGVYLPTIQNIFGVILFTRVTWMVGVSGSFEFFMIVLLCCCTTMLTAISMSAIATNGVVPGGGSYFMISRSLGPEFGGAVGILFYLGTTFASAMYIIGAVEILLKYLVPQGSLFGDITVDANAFNNYRCYGTVLLLLLSVCVFLGVKIVSIFASISLACTLLSMLAIYIGIFAANPDSSVKICVLGGQLLSDKVLKYNDQVYCTKNATLHGTNITLPLYDLWCPENSNHTRVCDPFFMKSEIQYRPGIPGLGGGVFSENVWSKYATEGSMYGSDETVENAKSNGVIVADITTTFMIMLGIFFPSVTGIMAGSNRSGDLKDASSSIPIGTICAIATTSFVYLTCVLFFSGCVDGLLLRDKFGESISGSMVVANLAWPHPYVIMIGSFLSTLGAGLQSLTGAPRLLQAIAKDGGIPFINIFEVTTKKGEPFRALLLTVCISEIGILIGNLDSVAPIITMFFLMCYGFVNLACSLQSILKSPSWRPRFRFYHWTLSLLGLGLCIALMFISSWYYALGAMIIAFGIYKYIEYKGAEKEWGDGLRGLALSAARYALLKLEDGPPHTKNWRPQLLVLCKLKPDLDPKYPALFDFASQLKAGKGLTLVASILKGDFQDRYADLLAAKQTLSRVLDSHKIKGLVEIIVSRDVVDGITYMIQAGGLGGLRPNTVVVGWPYGWRHSADEESHSTFLETVRNCNHAQQALLVAKNIQQFPSSQDKCHGTIDVWWIVHDGGMLMLLPFLLQQHKVWKSCKLRIFTVAQVEDNSIQMKKDLETFLYHLRITAEIFVVEMMDNDISAYTYERTLMMEQRTKLLNEMKLTQREQQLVVQSTGDVAHAAAAVTERGARGSIKRLSDVVDKPSNDTLKLPTQLSPMSDGPGGTDSFSEKNLYTFTAGKSRELLEIKPEKRNVRRMHTAVKLNEHIVEKSHNADLVMLNLPGPPKNQSGDLNYMEYLEVLTEGLERVLMVRGGGCEVVTIFS